jgi:hypothetical protein
MLLEAYLGKLVFLFSFGVYISSLSHRDMSLSQASVRVFVGNIGRNKTSLPKSWMGLGRFV